MRVGERTENVCQGGWGRNIGVGGEDSCEMRIQAEQSDHGSWTCLLTLAKDYHSTTTYLGMEVAVRPRLRIQQHHDGNGGHDGQAGLMGQAVHLLLGIPSTAWQNKGFPDLRFTGQLGTRRPWSGCMQIKR